jgi:hypothetical protein
MNAMNATANDWTQIEPLLDDAMAALDETDRAAILLRYFENKNLREVGRQLGIGDDAAQKRVSRAVERLREFFSKKKITLGASSLGILISANAVQAAPIGLAATISAAVLTGAAIPTSSAITTTKIIAMTTLQKTFITAALVATVSAGIFEAHQNSQLRGQIQNLQQQQSSWNEQIAQLQREHDNATNQITGLISENAQLKSNSNENELLKLRGEVGISHRQADEVQKLQADNRQLKQQLTENEIKDKQFAAEAWMRALVSYANNHQGQLPESFDQAASFLPRDYDDNGTVPDQYEMLYHGNLNALTNSDVIVFREKKLWRTENGRLGRFDVLASGRAQYGSAPDGTADNDLSDYEKENAAPMTNQ